MLYTKILSNIHRVLALIVFTVSATVMFGWFTENESLIQLSPLFAPMVFNTAFCLSLLSFALVLPEVGFPRLSTVLSGIVALIGLLTLAEYFFSIDLFIDAFLMKPYYGVGVTVPGRMAVSTAVCFNLLSITMLFKRPRFAWQMVSVTTAALVLGFAIISIVGYAVGFNAEYGWGSFARMALHTSVCLALLAFAVLMQLRSDVRKVSSRRSALVPFYVLTVGVLLTTLIWQLLILRDQERNRTVTQIRLDSFRASIDNAFIPVIKSMEHMAKRFSMNGYPQKSLWDADAESYLQEFPGIRRLWWADQERIMRWIHPQDEGSYLLLNNRLGTNNKSLVPQVEEVVKGRQLVLSKVFDFRTGGRGIVVFLPIHDAKKVFKGIVGASILVEPFFSQISLLEGYSIEILEDNVKIFSRGSADPVYERDWLSQGFYSNMGVRWHIKIVPTPEQIRANTSALPGVVLLFGVSVSVLLGVALSFYNLSRASEAQLKKAFEWNKAGIDSSSLLMISLDENTLVREMNAAAEKMLGYETSELAGKTSPLMFYDPTEVRAFTRKMEVELGYNITLGREFMDALFKLGLHRASEWTQISRTGERYTVINSTSEIRDEKGNLTGYLQILEDVTELKAKEKLLAEQEMKIVASSRMASLGEMAAGIAHEINNPLAIINGHAGVLRKQLQQKGLGEDTEIVKKVEAIESVVQRIAKIIKGLRSFARETDSREDEWITVEALLEETLSFSRERFKGDGVELITRVPADLKIKCQPHQISQVILNLLNNALDAVQNSKNKSVIIEALARPGGVEISVSDSGPGIPYDLRSRIMQPFFTTKEVGKGVGLGLSISQGIIQSHNGKFYLDEDAARTRFVIWLPV